MIIIRHKNTDRAVNFGDTVTGKDGREYTVLETTYSRQGGRVWVDTGNGNSIPLLCSECGCYTTTID